MDNLAVILGVDEKTIREELGEIKISKMVFSKVRELFDDDYDKFKKFYKYCKGNIPAMIFFFLVFKYLSIIFSFLFSIIFHSHLWLSQVGSLFKLLTL